MSVYVNVSVSMAHRNMHNHKTSITLKQESQTNAGEFLTCVKSNLCMVTASTAGTYTLDRVFCLNETYVNIYPSLPSGEFLTCIQIKSLRGSYMHGCSIHFGQSIFLCEYLPLPPLG